MYESEKAVLGGALLSQYLPPVRDEDFQSDLHRRIWAAMQQLSKGNAPIDIITVGAQLEKTGSSRAGDKGYISTLTNEVPSIDHIDHHADLVRRIARDVRFKVSIEEAYREVKAGADTDEVYMRIQDSLGNSTTKRLEMLDANKLCMDSIDHFDKLAKGEIPPGVHTGYHELDAVCPLQEEDLMIIAGRPSMGKTALAVGMAAGAFSGDSKQGVDPYPVLFFSLEMGAQKIMNRLISWIGGVNGQKLKKGNFLEADLVRMNRAIMKINQSPFTLVKDTLLSSREIRSTVASYIHKRKRRPLVIIDHLHLTLEDSKAQSQHVMYGQTIVGLKAMANDFSVPVVCLAQLNRGVDSRTPPIPVMSDIRESGTIEQTADQIIFPYRQDYYEEKELINEKNIDPTLRGKGRIIIGKQRDGETGPACDLLWVKETAAYKNL